MTRSIFERSGMILALAVTALLVVDRMASQASPPVAAQQPNPASPTSAAMVSDNVQAAKRQSGTNPVRDSPIDSRRKQMAEESADLLNLALALKAEVDKTNKDILSLEVIRRADQIERLAKTMRQNLRQ